MGLYYWLFRPVFDSFLPMVIKFITVKNKGYGNYLKGTKIYYEGKKPKLLAKDGSIKFGKNILEILKRKFPKFRWIITQDKDGITLERSIYRIRTSIPTLGKMNGELFDRTRDIKMDIIKHFFAIVYPGHFKSDDNPVYVAGSLGRILDKEIIPRLSTEDKDRLNEFLPDFIASESLSSVNLVKARTQIKSLKELATNLEQAIDGNHPESWWQTYIKSNILIIQQGYIQSIDKMNVSVGVTKFPDFSLVTHDDYLDILEIKKPTTNLIKLDNSRGNSFWDIEMSKAIIQTENYIENVSKHRDTIRSYLKDTYEINLQVLRPRGIILAGNTKQFTTQKERDDFRLLSQSMKNITIVTYNELLSRLNNYIKVLESFQKPKKG